MSFHVKDDFSPKAPIAAVGADWYNKVGGFINALVAGAGIKMSKPERPSVSAPVIIDIDPEVLNAKNEPTEEYKKFETPIADDLATPDYHREDALLETTWKRGTVGVSVYLPTDSWGTNVNRNTAWRLCHFDRYGRLERIDAQTIITKALNNEVLNN